MALRKPIVKQGGLLEQYASGDSLDLTGTNTFITLEEHSSAPGTPSANNVALYAKADGFLYSKNDAGTETQLGGGSVSEPNTQVVYGTGSGVDSSSTWTYAVTTGAWSLDPGSVAAPGNVSFNAADSATSGTAGGNMTITSGAGNGSGVGGTLTITGGTGGATAVGGPITITAGSGQTGGGALTLAGGAATSGTNNGGATSIAGGAANSGGTGGTLSLTGGAGGASAGTGGAVLITGGSTANGGTYGSVTVAGATGAGVGDGGSLTLQGGAGVGTNRNGGNVTITAGTATGSGTIGTITLNTNGTQRILITGLGSAVVGTAALATTATDGFLYIPTTPGVPTGVPTTFTGRSALTVDTTNNRLYGYDPVDATWLNLTGSATPGGSNTQIQYNNAGAFGGASGLTTDGTNLTIAGNLIFSGTARRITGDFSNATLSNVTSFQTTTTNSYTLPYIIPNGTSDTAGIGLLNNSTGTNAGHGQIYITNGQLNIISTRTGTGTTWPMVFYVGDTVASTTQRLLLSTTGNVVVGNAALATNATDGFLYIPTMPGVPTGVPTTFTGRSALTVDTTNNRLYGYDPVDNTWLNLTGSGGGTVTSVSGGTTGLTFNTPTTTPTMTGTLLIANGGTGQVTANAALNALLPPQAGNAGEFLTTDGTNTSWAVAGGGSSALSSVTAAVANNTINNSANLQLWNWQLTANLTQGMTFGENVASTNGAGNNQNIVRIRTLSGSTAAPFYVDTRGLSAFIIKMTGGMEVTTTDSSTINSGGGLTIANGNVLFTGMSTITVNTGVVTTFNSNVLVNGLGGAVLRSIANDSPLLIGNDTSIVGVAGAASTITGNAGQGTGNAGGSVTVRGGTAGDGNGGAVTIAGRDGVGTNRSGGVVTISGGLRTGSGTGGRVVIQTGQAGLTDRLSIDQLGAWTVGGGVGTAGQVLTSNGAGTPPTWQTSGSGTPGGANTQIQYNNSGAFGGDADFTWDAAGNVLTIAGNQTFSGTTRRITGDFSNATASNRVIFQSSTTNGNTFISTIPNGTALLSGFVARNASDADNAGSVAFRINGTDAQIATGATGTGTVPPLVFLNNATEVVRITTANSVVIGTAALSTTATDGFLYIPTTPGVPTGVPTTYTGRAALTVDTTNNRLYGYDPVDAVWLNLTGAGGGGGLTISDDTTTNATRYVTFTSATSGSISTANVSSTKLTFNPSTGTLSATVFNTLSDETVKTDVHTIEDAVDTVKQLNGVEFKWKETGAKSYGVIAQQLEQIIPDLVETGPEGLKSVNYNGIIGFLIEAVKELSARVEQLENK